MAPSKADKKKKDKKGDGGASQSDNNHNSANKNLCCVPKGKFIVWSLYGPLL